MAEAPGRTAAVADAAHCPDLPDTARRFACIARKNAGLRPWPVARAGALCALLLFAGPSLIVPATNSGGGAHAASATTARAPSWAQLPQAQKAFLAPLEETWDSLSVQTRRKLIGIAQRQATMTSEQRERVQSRLSQWAQLSTEEQERARKNYQQLNKLPADQRQDLARRWQGTRQPGPAGTEASGEGPAAAPQP
jgi:hypothetical protein